jgi:hypothetical protein
MCKDKEAPDPCGWSFTKSAKKGKLTRKRVEKRDKIRFKKIQGQLKREMSEREKRRLVNEEVIRYRETMLARKAEADLRKIKKEQEAKEAQDRARAVADLRRTKKEQQAKEAQRKRKSEVRLLQYGEVGHLGSNSREWQRKKKIAEKRRTHHKWLKEKVRRDDTKQFLRQAEIDEGRAAEATFLAKARELGTHDPSPLLPTLMGGNGHQQNDRNRRSSMLVSDRRSSMAFEAASKKAGMTEKVGCMLATWQETLHLGPDKFEQFDKLECSFCRKLANRQDCPRRQSCKLRHGAYTLRQAQTPTGRPTSRSGHKTSFSNAQGSSRPTSKQRVWAASPSAGCPYGFAHIGRAPTGATAAANVRFSAWTAAIAAAVATEAASTASSVYITVRTKLVALLSISLTAAGAAGAVAASVSPQSVPLVRVLIFGGGGGRRDRQGPDHVVIMPTTIASALIRSGGLKDPEQNEPRLASQLLTKTSLLQAPQGGGL